jgi:hypothetical protein
MDNADAASKDLTQPRQGPEGPEFPIRALVLWLGIFCACVALVTAWATPLDLLIKIALSAVFALVPVGILIYWLGAFMDHRRRNRRGIDTGRAPQDDGRS